MCTKCGIMRNNIEPIKRQQIKEPMKKGTEERIIMGIDPGYARVGWGVVNARGVGMDSLGGNGSEKSAVSEPCSACVDYGCFETGAEEEFATRLAMINAELLRLIAKYKPTDIVVEELFWGRIITTGIKVSMARGIVFLRAAEHTGRIYEYKPNYIKQTITGLTKADKKQMQESVRSILGLENIPKPDDAADALAIAITHAVAGTTVISR